MDDSENDGNGSIAADSSLAYYSDEEIKYDAKNVDKYLDQNLHKKSKSYRQ